MKTVASAQTISAATRPELLNADGHVCGFFHSEDEQYSVLMPFIKEGLDNGERAWNVIDPARRDEHVRRLGEAGIDVGAAERSEEHTSELQSLMSISYAVFCLKKKKQQQTLNTNNQYSI